MITSANVAAQVRRSLPGIEIEYDIPAIVREIVLRFGPVDIDTIESSVYWIIVARHDLGAIARMDSMVDDLTPSDCNCGRNDCGL